MKKLFYPAVFEYEQDGGHSVYFPDLQGCNTQGESIEEAYEMAFDALGLWLEVLADDKGELPQASKPHEIDTALNQSIVLVEFDMLEYQKKHNSKAVKKTLTIPGWLDEEAQKRNINFSQTLQDVLVQKIMSN